MNCSNTELKAVWIFQEAFIVLDHKNGDDDDDA